MNAKLISKWIISLLIITNSSLLMADTAKMGALVENILIANPLKYGACMVKLSKEITPTTGLNCPGSWVSFSCSGDFNPKDIAYKMLDAANLSLALGNQLLIVVNDFKKHNGYCVADRVDILPVPTN